MNIANWLHANAFLNPDAPALLSGTRLISNYSQFALNSSSIAKGLSQRFDIVPGDHIGLLMNNCTEYLEALYGIWYAGAVAVPINAKLHGSEAAWILDNAGAKLVIVDKEDRLPADTNNQHKTHPPRLNISSVEFDQLKSGTQLSVPAIRAEDDLA